MRIATLQRAFFRGLVPLLLGLGDDRQDENRKDSQPDQKRGPVVALLSGDTRGVGEKEGDEPKCHDILHGDLQTLKQGRLSPQVNLSKSVNIIANIDKNVNSC